METGEILNTILIVSISISILVLTFFLARLLNEIRLVVRETREVTSNVANLTNGITNTVNSVSSFVNGNMIASGFSKVGVAAGAFGFLNKFFKGRNKKED